MVLRVVEAFILIILVTLAITQLVVPIVRGEFLFPMFRRRAQYKNITGLNEEMARLALEQLAEDLRDRIKQNKEQSVNEQNH